MLLRFRSLQGHLGTWKQFSVHTHTYTPLHIYDQKTTCQFFSGRVASDNYSYSEMVVLKAGSLLFWPDSTETFMADLLFGERWFNRQAVLGKIDFTRGRKLFLETALDRRNWCSLLYVGIFVGNGENRKKICIIALSESDFGCCWLEFGFRYCSHKRWYTNQDLILHSGIPYTLPFAHVLNHDLESSISCMLMQTWLHHFAEHCSLNAIRNYTILTFNNK